MDVRFEEFYDEASKRGIQLEPDGIKSEEDINKFILKNNDSFGFEIFEDINELDLDFIFNIDFRKIIKNKILPIKKEKNIFYYAALNPFNGLLEKEINNKVEYHRMITKQDFLLKSYSILFDFVDIGDNFVEDLMRDAIDKGISDIHIEAKKRIVSIRYRKDGVLYLRALIGRKNYSKINSKIKVAAGFNIGEKNVIQSGRINFNDNEFDYSVRVSLMPSLFGDKVVMRILNNTDPDLKLEELGFTNEIKEKLLEVSKIPYGIVLFTGPTGSGKTTTQMSILKKMDTDEKNIILIEDPIEYVFSGGIQMEVNEEKGLDYNALLKESLRQDPDIVVIGEIRDKETAQTAFNAANTGNVVFATMHTNTAIDSINRLLDFDIEISKIYSLLKYVVSQRLIRKLCDKCKLAFNLEGEKVFGENGCEECAYTGFHGRIPLVEVISFSDSIELLADNRTNYEKIYIDMLKKDLKKLSREGRMVMLNGNTSHSELIRIFGSDC